MMISAARRILLVRTSALGDLVHTLPVLSALKRFSPECRIAWVVEEAFAELLEDHPDLDVVIPVRLRVWRRQPLSRDSVAGSLGAVRSLRRFAPDLALELMGNHKGGALALLSGAPTRVGAARGFRREPSSAVWINEPVEARGDHAVDRTLSLLSSLGIDPGEADFSGDKILSTPCPDALRFLESQQGPFILLQSNAGWGNKSYPLAWLGRVGRELRSQSGFPVYALAGPGEDHLAKQVQEASEGAVRALSSPTLRHLATLAREARLMVGGDTGPIHLAHSLGTEVLCLMGPTGSLRHGPHGAPERALWAGLPCSPCNKRFPEPRPCLLHWTPGRVVERSLELLDLS